MRIELKKLKQITDSIFEHVEKDLKVTSVELESDYYWNIPSDAAYDMNADPKELDVGQLYDDWEFLEKLIADKDQASPLMLLHLAPLLRYVGEKLSR